MANLNQVFLIGNLTREVELSYLPSHVAVANFGLAVNRTWRKDDGTEGEEVGFFECVVFGKRAEAVSKYLGKGSPVFVQGRLKYESWEKSGQKHSRVKVIVERFEFLGGRRGDGKED